MFLATKWQNLTRENLDIAKEGKLTKGSDFFLTAAQNNTIIDYTTICTNKYPAYRMRHIKLSGIFREGEDAPLHPSVYRVLITLVYKNKFLV